MASLLGLVARKKRRESYGRFHKELKDCVKNKQQVDLYRNRNPMLIMLDSLSNSSHWGRKEKKTEKKSNEDAKIPDPNSLFCKTESAQRSEFNLSDVQSMKTQRPSLAKLNLAAANSAYSLSFSKALFDSLVESNNKIRLSMQQQFAELKAEAEVYNLKEELKTQVEILNDLNRVNLERLNSLKIDCSPSQIKSSPFNPAAKIISENPENIELKIAVKGAMETNNDNLNQSMGVSQLHLEPEGSNNEQKFTGQKRGQPSMESLDRKRPRL